MPMDPKATHMRAYTLGRFGEVGVRSLYARGYSISDIA